MSKVAQICSLGIAIGTLACSSLAQDYRYAMFKIESPGDNAQAFGINRSGLICGQAKFTYLHSFVWTPPVGPTIELNALDGWSAHSSWGYAINDLGWVVGWTDSFAPDTAATLWKPDGTVINLGSLEGSGGNAKATAVNNYGAVVGESSDPESQWTQAFIWNDGTMRRLPNLSNNTTSAQGINDDGVIVGFGGVLSGKRPPVYWSDTDDDHVYEIYTIGTGNSGAAYDINNDGVVVGEYNINSNVWHAFMWTTANGLRDLHAANFGFYSGAFAVNTQGEVVGITSFDEFEPFDSAAFVWNETAGMRDLNDLIPPLTGEWIYWANDINDAGQIVVKSGVPDTALPRDTHLLSPVSPSMTLKAIGHGGALVAGANNALRITGATPGARITFLWSSKGGGEAIPGCDLQENALQLDSPTIIGTATANAQGVATLQRFVPSAAQGKTILLQAVAPSGCAISQLMMTTVE